MENAALKYTRTWQPETSLNNDSLSLIYNRVTPGTTVLDVGCSVGQLGAALKSRKNCTVIGIDIEPEAVNHAVAHLDQALVCDVIETPLSTHPEISKFRYHYIIFADVLEHLSDPLQVLIEAQKLLAPDGSILISIPNFAHASVRLSLLEGRFEYSEEGLLDKTHVRFYTKLSFYKLLMNAGLVPLEIERTYLGACDTEIPIVERGVITKDLIASLESLPEATTYQFIAQVVPTSHPLLRTAVFQHFDNFEREIKDLEGENLAVRTALGLSAGASLIDAAGNRDKLLEHCQQTSDSLKLTLASQQSTVLRQLHAFEGRIQAVENSISSSRDLHSNLNSLRSLATEANERSLKTWNLLPIKLWRLLRGR